MTSWQNLPELIQQGLMRQKVDVFDMVVCLVAPLCLLFGLSWRDTFQDAQPPAI